MALIVGLVKGAALIIFSSLLLPLYTFILLSSCIVSPFTQAAKNIHRHRQWRASSSSTFRPRVILVAGVARAESLTVARTFYRAGHRVIGVDFEPFFFPVLGRFSVALAKFHRLRNPSTRSGLESCHKKLANIIKKEGVELIVCCSNDQSIALYAEMVEVVGRLTGCKTIQFSAALTRKLLDSDYFLEETLSLGLNVSETPIKGPTYLTQSIIINGKVLGFASCRLQAESADYKALHPTSAISMAMLECAQVYAKELGTKEAGHLSLTFVLDQDDLETDLRKKIYPIRCSPNVQSHIVLFFDESEHLSEAYCTVLPDHEPTGIIHQINASNVVTPETSEGIYWMWDCAMALLIKPLLDFIKMRIDIWSFLASWVYFIEHVLFWKEGAFEVWDPWPAWWLYGWYRPVSSFLQLLTGAT